MLASCDFMDQITGEVTVTSSWLKEKAHHDACCQAGPIITAEREVQTVTSALQPVNTCEKQVGHERKPIEAAMDGLQYVYSGVDYDEEKLAAFLEEAKEDVLSMLYRNTKSTAFNNYEPNWSSKSGDIALMATFFMSRAVESELHALGVCWNRNGTLLAVAYGRMDTTGWCHSSGVVGVWNLSRHDVDVNAPHYTLETDAFATCVAFHPAEAAVLAVGLYNGEVLMYADVTGGDPLVMSTNGSPASHREPVIALQWTQSLQEIRESHRYILCSAAQDGSILFWTPTNKLAQPIAAFFVENKKCVTVGVQSFCFARNSEGGAANVPSTDSPMIIGFENGDVGRARPGALSVLALRGSSTFVPLDVNWLSGHKGPVQSVDMSPFFHNLCLTCSSDGSVHLYNVLERSPLSTLEPSANSKHFLYAAQFSSFRPSVLAAASRSSFLHVYDLQASHLRPAASVEAGVDGAPVLCMAFNCHSPELLVTGDARGCVRLWKMPPPLVQTTDLERAAVHEARSRGKKNNSICSLFGFAL